MSLIFTPRVIRDVWKIINRAAPYLGRHAMPSVDVFLAHYAASAADPGFAWSWPEKGIGYLYDVTINQLQLTPEVEPEASRVRAVNRELWVYLRPELLDEPSSRDWKSLWRRAAKGGDTSAMLFILDQGVGVDAFFTPGEWKELWRISVGRLDRPVLHRLFGLAGEARATLQEPDWRKMWEWACRLENYEGLRFLLDQHADLTAVVDWAGMWRTAVDKYDFTMMRFIREQGIELRGLMQPGAWRVLLETAVDDWRLDMVEFLAGLDIGAAAVDWTPLWKKAVAKRNVQAMRLVVRQGVDVDALMGAEGWKALYFDAARYADVEALRFVLDRGLDVRVVDPGGRALDDVTGQFGGSPEAVELLVEAGIELGDVEALIAFGATTPSSAGEAQNHMRIARYLRVKAAQRSASRTEP